MELEEPSVAMVALWVKLPWPSFWKTSMDFEIWVSSALAPLRMAMSG